MPLCALRSTQIFTRRPKLTARTFSVAASKSESRSSGQSSTARATSRSSSAPAWTSAAIRSRSIFSNLIYHLGISACRVKGFAASDQGQESHKTPDGGGTCPRALIDATTNKPLVIIVRWVFTIITRLADRLYYRWRKLESGCPREFRIVRLRRSDLTIYWSQPCCRSIGNLRQAALRLQGICTKGPAT